MMHKEEMDQELPDKTFPDPEYDEATGDPSKLGEIYKQIPKIMEAVGPVAKSQVNTRFKGQSIEDIYNALNKAMFAHGVFTTSDIIEYSREERETTQGGTLLYTLLRIQYTFWAPDGSCVKTVVQGEGMDSGDKSANKAMSAAHKYALKQIFLIPTEGEDPDSESHQVAPRQTRSRQKPDPTPRAQGVTARQRQKIDPDIVRALMSCEDIKTLQEMWAKIDSKPIYEGTKNLRKDQLEIAKADIDQAAI